MPIPGKIKEADKFLLRPGEELGNYRISAPISHSYTGETYLASHQISSKKVILKMLPLILSHDDMFKERFKEAELILSKLVHPNILQIQAMGCEKDIYYIVSEYLEDKEGIAHSLEDELKKRNKLSEKEARKIIIQLANALIYAQNFNEGLIHSDLKPSNIFFDPSMKIKLTDFETIRLIGKEKIQQLIKNSITESLKDTVNRKKLEERELPTPYNVRENPMDTTTSFILLSQDDEIKLKDFARLKNRSEAYVKSLLGFSQQPVNSTNPEDKHNHASQSVSTILDSFDYMSPEQKARQEPTIQSSIYSVGLILYRMLTGQKMATSWGLPSAFGCNKNWDAIILKALKPNPKERYESIEEFKEDIKNVFEARETKSRVLVYGVITLLILIIIGIVFKSANIFDTDLKNQDDFKNDSKTKFVITDLKNLKNDDNSPNSSPSGKVKKEFTNVPIMTKFPEFNANWRIAEIDMDFVFIRKGSFVMGSDDSESQKDEKPLHQVEITRPFWIGKNEVSQRNYMEIIGTNPSKHIVPDFSTPVEKVTWYDAIEFCRRLTLREKNSDKLPEGYIYRLPTEAEWEYACRAGTRTTFFFGDDSKPIHDYSWNLINSKKLTQSISSKRANQWGIHDVYGNVMEWCLDSYKAYTPDKKQDPYTNKGSYKVLRGGSIQCQSPRLRSAKRFKLAPGYTDSTIGFRVALAPILTIEEDE